MANLQNIEKFYSRASTRDFSRDFLFRVKSLNIRDLVMGDDDLVYVKWDWDLFFELCLWIVCHSGH